MIERLSGSIRAISRITEDNRANWLPAAGAALGGFVGGLTFSRRSYLASRSVRTLSRARKNAVAGRGIKVDLGPVVGEWSSPVLVASLDHTLSEVLGRKVEGAAFSRFGEFAGRSSYSRFLDPTSPYYQAWLGAYVVLDSPDGQFGFEPSGEPRLEDALAALEADQRLVYRSTGCPNRFSDGRCTRLVESLDVTRPVEDGWWKLRGQAETWSSYSRGSEASNVWGRALYGVVPRNADHNVDDFHPLTYTGEFWIRHDAGLAATCCVFTIVPRFTDRDEVEQFPGRDLLNDAVKWLDKANFSRK